MRIDALLEQQKNDQPEGLAVIDWDGRKQAYSDQFNAARTAADLLKKAGVAAGDRVFLVAENCAALCSFIFGCSMIGAWAIPVNARQTAFELNRIIDHATPRVGVFFNAVSKDAKEHAQRLGAHTLEGLWGETSLAVLGPSDPAPDQDVAVVLYTTGTTGIPKGVMLTHDNLIFAGKTSVQTRGMRVDDIVYGVLPISHVFGLASMLIAVTAVGATALLETRFRAEALYNALVNGVTILPAVPQMHALLLTYVETNALAPLPRGILRFVSSGAAPLDPVWKRKAEDFYGIALQNGYGMTETTAGVCTTQNPKGSPDLSVGPALPGVEIAIDTTVQGGGDGIGDVLTRGPHIMKGYFRNREATQAVLDAEGWMHTGDLGTIDEQQRLHILGRSKELIIRGGFNVYPPEVEAALNDHPEVIHSAVVGRATPEGTEEVLGFVQVSEASKLTQDDLKAFVSQRLTAYKRPNAIVVASSLPAAPTGKILKHRLIDVFAEELKNCAAQQKP